MPQTVRAPVVSFTYTLHEHGWARAELVISSRSVSLLVSYLSDALGDLVRATAELAKGLTRVAVLWVEEPGTHELIFEQRSFMTQVCVEHHLDLTPTVKQRSGQQIFAAQCGTVDLCSAIAIGTQEVLDEFGTEGYLARWRLHPFPTGALAELRGLLPTVPAAMNPLSPS